MMYENFSASDVSNLTVSEVESLTPQDIIQFPVESLSGATLTFLESLPSNVYTSFTADHISNLSPEVMGADNIMGMLGNLPEAAFAGFTPEHIGGFEISPELLMTPSYENIMTFQPDTLEAFENAWNSESNTNFNDYLQSISTGQISSLNQFFDLPGVFEPPSEEEPALEQAAAEAVVEESTSEPPSEEEPAPEQAAAEAVVEESTSEPPSEEELALEQAAAEAVVEESASEPPAAEELALEQAATGDVEEETASEPVPKEELALEQAATGAVVEESASEPVPKEELLPTQVAAEDVVEEREREEQHDDRASIKGTLGKDREQQEQWGEKGESLKGVKFDFFGSEEEHVPKSQDSIFQSKGKSIDQNENDQSGSPPPSQFQNSILTAIDKQMAANMAEGAKENSKSPDDENSNQGANSQHNENTEI